MKVFTVQVYQKFFLKLSSKSFAGSRQGFTMDNSPNYYYIILLIIIFSFVIDRISSVETRLDARISSREYVSYTHVSMRRVAFRVCLCKFFSASGCTCVLRLCVCVFCIRVHTVYTRMDDLYVMVGTDGGGWLHGEQVQAG